MPTVNGLTWLLQLLRGCIKIQQHWSKKFDRLLPQDYLIDGNRFYCESFAPKFVKSGQRIVDIGGGRQPLLRPEMKAKLNLWVTGLDWDARELMHAPRGAYDAVIQADIMQYQGEASADLVICQSLLEHVRDVRFAFQAMASILKPGGIAVLFVPSRNALYARLNMLLPQIWKTRLLHFVFPHTVNTQGFPAYYNHCTPRAFIRIGREHGLELLELQCFFSSSYFSVLFPLHVAWRMWQMAFRTCRGVQAAETFCMALRKV